MPKPNQKILDQLHINQPIPSWEELVEIAKTNGVSNRFQDIMDTRKKEKSLGRNDSKLRIEYRTRLREMFGGPKED